MAAPSRTFSESWYRVANQKVCLRPVVRARRQYFRGERWIVLENPFSNQFFRLRPEAYAFVGRLRPELTVEEVWQQCLARFPDTAPSQESVIQILSQLYYANLLQYDLAADSARLFERYQKRRQRELGFQFLNVMFMRFPLLDPDRFLVATLPAVGWLISWFGAVLWCLMVGFGLVQFFNYLPALRGQGEGLLTSGNLPLLYLGLVLVKTAHELGHAYFCRRFGGEVHVLGVMLMIFTPMPYVDATSSWSFRERWQRVLVGAAGMIVDLFNAAIAAFIWTHSAPGVAHQLAYNIMVVASVSTLIFNLNPLMRFDGYYILSDLLEIPNLNQRAMLHLRHLFEHYVFRVQHSESPAATVSEARWLTVFGITSSIYRIIVFAGILLAVADRFLLIGLIMAVACLISWAVVPVVQFVKYLSASPRLDRVRTRAISITCGALAVLIILLAVVPFPHSFTAPGVVAAARRMVLANPTAGRIVNIFIQSGQSVTAGQPVLQLSNPELDQELIAARARLEEANARYQQAMKEDTSSMQPIAKLRDAANQTLAKLNHDAGQLTLRAPFTGVWVCPQIEERLGTWIDRGSDLGLVVNPAAYQFVATVREEDGNALFRRDLRDSDARLSGSSDRRLTVSHWKVNPGGQQVLPSAALGWAGGGDVPVANDNDSQGDHTVEPFFEIRGDITNQSDVVLLDGRSGRARFWLEPEPLIPRWFRSLRQLLQKRYEI
jgi:putative peptide zinc metalloprotease protein